MTGAHANLTLAYSNLVAIVEAHSKVVRSCPRMLRDWKQDQGFLDALGLYPSATYECVAGTRTSISHMTWRPHTPHRTVASVVDACV